MKLNEAKNGLVWAKDANAASYVVTLNNEAITAEGAYAFSETDGSYTLSVTAKGDGTNYVDSDAATFAYVSSTVALSDLTVTGATVSFEAKGLTVYSAFSQEDDEFEDGDWAVLEGDKISLDKNGYVGVKAVAGYDETNKIFYHGDAVAKTKLVVGAASKDLVIFDTDTEIDDDLLIYKYSSGWVEAGGNASMRIGKLDRLESEESVIFSLQKFQPYMIERALAKHGDAYEGMQITVRGDDESTIALQAAASFGYIEYNLGVLSSNWHTFRLPFTDTKWIAHVGSDVTCTLAQAAASMGVSAAQANYFFENARLVVNTVYPGDYNHFANIAVKSFIRLSSECTLADEINPTAKGVYSGILADGTTALKVDLDNKQFATLNLKSNIAAPISASIEGDKISVKTADNGASLTLTGTLLRDGAQIKVDEASGTYGAMCTGLVLNTVYDVENFESYTETGVGYDQNNTADKRSGLRANYIADYYAGSGTSPLSGSNWQLMGSSDYLDLGKDNGHSGNAGKFKSKAWNAMRFLGYDLYEGNGVALPRGDTFSFWAKNLASNDVPVTVLLAPNKIKVTASDLNTDAYKHAVTIPASSDWAQYTIEIDPTKFYAGFALTFANNKVGDSYVLIDDVQVYTAANPWAEYVAEPDPLTAGVFTGLLADGTTVAKIDIAKKTFETLNLETNQSFAISVEQSGSKLVMKSAADEGATITYEGTLALDGGSITCTKVSGALATMANGLNLNIVYSVDDFESYTETGVGYDKSNGADARTGLRAEYLADYYAGSGSSPLSGANWSLMGSADYLALDTANGHVEGQAAKFKSGGNAMRFTTYGLYDGSATAYPKGDTFSFWAKNPYDATITLTVRLFPDMTKVSSSDFGVESYKHAITIEAQADWKQYTIALDATKALAGYSFNFQRSGSVTAYPLIDDIQIYTAANPWAEYVAPVVPVVPSGMFTGLLADGKTVAKLDLDNNKFATLNRESNLDTTIAWSVEDSVITVKTPDSGASLTYVGTVSEDLHSIAYKSASGTYAALATNLNLNIVVNVDNFESYTETGVGYDQSHAASARSGLRAIYLADYYSGSGSSPLSGDKWSLMGSADYLALDTENGHSGNAAKFKSGGNAMRFTTYGLYDGSATAYASGKTFSFWMKNPSANTITLTVRLFPGMTKVSSSDFAVESYKHPLTIAANSDWTQYTINFDEAVALAGYSFNFQRASGSETAYPLIDDIQIYTSANPWATYVAA